VDIELIEFYKKSDFVLANLYTLSYGDFLESAGMIHITIKQNGEELRLKNGKSIEIIFPTREEGDRMEVFSGFPGEYGINWLLQKDLGVQTDSIRGEVGHKWSKNKVSVKRGGFLINDSRYYRSDLVDWKKFNQFNNLIMKSARLGWINSDRFGGKSNNTSVEIIAKGPGEPEIKMVFKDINSVLPYYKGYKEFSDVPVGERVTVIAFSMVDDVPYYAAKEFTVTAGQVLEIELQKTTLDAMGIELQKLN
jgi:hypothetical protein